MSLYMDKSPGPVLTPFKLAPGSYDFDPLADNSKTMADNSKTMADNSKSMADNSKKEANHSNFLEQ